MNAWTIALLAVACCALYRYFQRKLSYFRDLGVPHQWGLPLLGNMSRPLFRVTHLAEFIRWLYNAHPGAKYIGVYEFTRPTFVIRDPGLAKRVLIKDFDCFSDRDPFVGPEVDPVFGNNLFLIKGERWKETRSIMLGGFTSAKLKNMYEMIDEIARRFTDHLGPVAKDPENLTAAVDFFKRYVNDVLAACAFGISVDSLQDPKNDFYTTSRKMTDFEGFLPYKFFLSRPFSYIVRLLGIKFISAQCGDFYARTIGKTMTTRDEDGTRGSDMLQVMMDARGKTSENVDMTLAEMTSQLVGVLFASMHSSSNVMCLLAHELAINPDVQRKLQDEIDQLLSKTDGKPTCEDIQDLPYLSACYTECTRLHPQSYFLDRICTQAFDMPAAMPGGRPFTMKPGTNVWVPVYALQRDPEIYEDPERFHPERYLKAGEAASQMPNMSFGLGPRGCLGRRFAIFNAKILFFHLIARFNLKENRRICKPLTYNKNSIVNCAAGGFWLHVEPRSK